MTGWTMMVPNVLSGIRVALVPVLWVVALRGDAQVVGLGLVAAGVTDVLDGFLARRLGAVTPGGAALDSLGDNLLAPSAAVWLVLLRPDVATHFAAPLCAWAGLYLAFLTVGLVKFRRFGNLHLYSTKAATAAGYVFITWCFLFPGIPETFGRLVFGLAVLSMVEALVCQLVCRDIDEHVGSLLRVVRRRRAAAGRREMRPGATTGSPTP